MKRVKRRATAALILAVVLLIGLAFFAMRLVRNGAEWAMFPADKSVFYNGVLDTGTLTDCNGTLLAHAGNGVYYYADSALTRVSCLHVVGDYGGNISSGAVNAFAQRLSGYDFLNGTYSSSPEGETVALTIDASLNEIAYSALAGRNGAVLVMNYQTGELLCMVSTPSYDPNTTPDLTNPKNEGIYVNRAIGSALTPGSVFKIVTLSKAIETIPDLYSRSFSCSGSVTIGGHVVTCSGVHGVQTIEQAFANSCNCAFAELALEIGSQALVSRAEELGLTSSHDLNGIATASGRVDSAENGSADLAWCGIGQYTDLVCPYSLLRLVAAVANGGICAEPTLLPGESAGQTSLLSVNTANRLAEMMDYNVVSSYGSWIFPGLAVCAKTGTAETGNGSPHAWFAGFLKDEDDPLAFVVVVENGGSGLSAAAPVANAVLQAAKAR